MWGTTGHLYNFFNVMYPNTVQRKQDLISYITSLVNDKDF